MSIRPQPFNSRQTVTLRSLGDGPFGPLRHGSLPLNTPKNAKSEPDGHLSDLCHLTSDLWPIGVIRVFRGSLFVLRHNACSFRCRAKFSAKSRSRSRHFLSLPTLQSSVGRESIGRRNDIDLPEMRQAYARSETGGAEPERIGLRGRN